MITVTNVDTIEHVWCGQTLEPSQTFTLPDGDSATAWANNSIFLTAVANGLALVGNGSVTYSDVNTAINFLKGVLPASVSLTGTKFSSMGNLIVEPGIFSGTSGTHGVSLLTPDLTNRTTWYQKSVQVVGEALADSGDGLTFTSANPWWVNIYAPTLTYTYKQIPTRSGAWGAHTQWAVLITVNGTIVTSGYTVNYVAGTVTFTTSQSGNTITATYWTTNGVSHPSEWLLIPPPGHKLVVEHVELQFSVGVQLTDTLRFEVWAGGSLSTYGTFPDALFNAGYGQLRADYRNAFDFLNAANLGQGVVSQFGGLTRDTIILPFNYIQAFTLDSAVGAIFRVCLLNDTPYANADFATGTFYFQLS